MTSYDDTKVQLTINRMTEECYENVPSKSSTELYLISQDPTSIAKIDLDAQSRTDAEISSIQSDLNDLSTEVSDISSEVSTLSEWTTNQIDDLIGDVQEVSSQTTQNTQDIADMSASIADISANLTHSTVRRWEYVEYDGLTFTAGQANSTISMQKVGDAPNVSLEYSTGNGWSDFEVGTTTITLPNIGDQVVVRAKTTNSTFATDLSSYNQFVMTGEVLASDSIMYLLKSDADLSAIPADYCFYHLFRDCSALTEAPELPAIALDDSCYRGMFRNTSLTEAPDLPATTLADSCYAYMFHSCSDLAQIMDELPVETLAESCYEGMFYHCTSLTTPPDLPSTTLAFQCYYHMFDGCTSLASAPELPATTLARACYGYMFLDCTSLVSAPELPATTLVFDCYHGMFMRCTSLENPPSELPATTMAEYCYVLMFNQCPMETAPAIKAETLATECFKSMFWDCTQLNEIRIAYTGNFSGQDVPTDAFANWVNNVSSTGTFYYDGSDTTTGINAIPTNWTVKKYSLPDGLRFTARDGGETVQLYKNGSAPDCSFEYSTDGEQTWGDLTLGTTFTLANAGDSISFRAKTAQPTLAYEYNRNHKFRFGSTGHLSVDGSFYALLRPDWKTAPTSGWMGTKSLRSLIADNTGEFDIENVQPLDWQPSSNCYEGLFYHSNLVGDVPLHFLPSTSLAYYCYAGMFEGSRISSAPELPATTLAEGCYGYMFKDNHVITTAPALPATTLANHCYRDMFQNCTALTTPPPALPAIDLPRSCYQGMFNGCTSLTSTPATLGATTMSGTDAMGGMFGNCTSLTSAFDINVAAPTIGAFYGTFYGCSSLTSVNICQMTSAPWNAFREMFYNCTSLTNAPDVFSSMTSVGQWAFSKTFYGCTSITQIPTLPSATGNGLANFCFEHMFEGCTGLTGTIDLTQFTDIQGTGNRYGAFDYAFVGCTGITKVDLSSLTTAHGIYHEFDGCTSLQELDLSNLETIRSDSQSVFENLCNGCTSLTTVYLNKLASMGSYNTQWHNAFNGCSSLQDIYMDETQTIPYFYNYNNATFYRANANYRIVVPDALYNDWIVASGWSDISSHIYPASTMSAA